MFSNFALTKMVKMFRRFLLSILLVCVALAVASAMPARGFRHVTVNDGLSRNSIYCMLQDSAGPVYIGTWDALHCYDGNKVRELLFTPTPRHPVRTVTALAQGRRGRIYVGTSQGIITYDVETGGSVPFAADSTSYVAQMLTDASGRLHVLDTSGLHSVYDMRTDELLTTFENVHCLAALPGGTVGPLTGNLIPGRRIVAAMAGEDGELWVSTRGVGVYHRADSGAEFRRVALPADVPEVSSLARFGKSVVMGTARGLWTYDPESGAVAAVEPNPSDPSALNDRQIMSLMTDDEGCLWVGTFFGGINLMSPTTGNFALLEHVNPAIGGHVISAVTADGNGCMWFGVEDGGLSRYDPRDGSVRNYSSHHGRRGHDPFVIATDNVQGVYADGDSLFVGMAYGGMDIFSISDGRLLAHCPPVESAPDFPPSVYAFRRGPDGALYIGTMAGLYRMAAPGGTVERVAQVPREIVHTLATAPGGNLLVASQGAGVFVFDGHRWTNIRSRGTKMAMSVCQTDSALYVGTEGNGLFRYDLATGRMAKVNLGTDSRLMVFSIVAHGRVLWVATNRGLLAYDTDAGTATRFTADDGLQSNQFKINSALAMADGTLVFGSVNGVNAFRPSELAVSGVAPRAIVTSLAVLADSSTSICALYADTVHVAADNRGLALQLASSSFGDVNKNRFSYRLDPIDDEWKEAASAAPSATYPALAEGVYTLRVRTANGGGVYGPERTLTVIVGSPSGIKGVLAGAVAVMAVLVLCGVAYVVARRRRAAQQAGEATLTLGNLPAALPAEGDAEADAEFMCKLDEIIDREMANVDLSVNDLAAMAGVGRSIFFRKVKMATGKTPNDYMRTRRLSRAAELLSRPDARVNQVCYQTGFSSPSYFSRCFTAQFGMTPSDYLSRRSR